MSNVSGYPNCNIVLAKRVCNLLYKLGPSTYDEVAPKIEYWIEHGLAEQLTTIDDLVEQVSTVAWNQYGSYSHISRFLKEFRETPRCSERARSFVDELCLYVLRWFGGASADDHGLNWYAGSGSGSGGFSFARTASFVGHLVKRGLLSRDLVRRYLPKPLTNHHHNDDEFVDQIIRANVIYALFTAAGNTLLQGLLEPEDVQVCFERLETRISLGEFTALDGFSLAELNELRETHATWLRQKEEEEQMNMMAAEVPVAEVETPKTPVPQDLPAPRISIDTPSSTSQVAEPVSASRSVESSPDTFVDSRTSAAPSPILSVSTVSDITSTEIGEDIGESSGELMVTRHDTFYFEDGNVEIVCEDTVFRVHSTIISFASSKLRDIFSLVGARPRIIFHDTAEDFAVLLKMIYTPGFPAKHKVPEFTVFASLLRMVTKYGFSDVREALVEDLKGAYPTSWEDFEAAKVLGEVIFGLPKPHPNAVLNLFLEQNIKFALPFAAYRAGLGDPSSLASGEPGAILPRPTLASIIHGMGETRRVMTVAAHTAVYFGNLGVCPEEVCALNVDIHPIKGRIKALNEVYKGMVERNEGDMLSPPSLRPLVCVSCAEKVERPVYNWRRRFFWARLPGLLGWSSREGI